jgi:hypothetical protein
MLQVMRVINARQIAHSEPRSRKMHDITTETFKKAVGYRDLWPVSLGTQEVLDVTDSGEQRRKDGFEQFRNTEAMIISMVGTTSFSKILMHHDSLVRPTVRLQPIP